MSLAHARADHSLREVESVQPRQPEPRRKGSIDPAVLISIFAVIVLAAALLHVAQRARLATLTLDLHEATSQLERLKRVQNELLVEIEDAQALNKVENAARDRLGMVSPEKTQWLVLGPGESDGASPGTERVAQREVSSRSWPWLTALSEWYNQVSHEIRAALPVPRGESAR